jgi:hypothetical protein
MTIESDDIQELASAPQEIRGDEGTVKERPIDEVIKADQYIAAKNTADQPLRGLRVSRCRLPGTP